MANWARSTEEKLMQATSIRRLLSYDIGAIFCSRLKASTLSVVATNACTHEQNANWQCLLQLALCDTSGSEAATPCCCTVKPIIFAAMCQGSALKLCTTLTFDQPLASLIWNCDMLSLQCLLYDGDARPGDKVNAQESLLRTRGLLQSNVT